MALYNTTLRLNPHFNPAAQTVLAGIEREYTAFMNHAGLVMENGAKDYLDITISNLNKASNAYDRYATQFFTQFKTFADFQAYVLSNQARLPKALKEDPCLLSTRTLRDSVAAYNKDKGTQKSFQQSYDLFIKGLTINP